MGVIMNGQTMQKTSLEAKTGAASGAAWQQPRPVEYRMERLFVFCDYANVEAAFADQGRSVDHEALLRYLGEGRFLVEAHAFVPIDPRQPTARDAAMQRLWDAGYLVHPKLGTRVGEGYRCDLDVEIVLEMMRTAELARPDIVVLISGDRDFIPLVLELRRRGVRVEVAALPQVNASEELRFKASGFINLNLFDDGLDDDLSALEGDGESLPDDDRRGPWESGD